MTYQPSSSDFIQASRVLKVKSPLGEDQLLPERMVINEGVSQLFEIQLNVRAKKESVKPEELIRVFIGERSVSPHYIGGSHDEARGRGGSSLMAGLGQGADRVGKLAAWIEAGGFGLRLDARRESECRSHGWRPQTPRISLRVSVMSA